MFDSLLECCGIGRPRLEGGRFLARVEILSINEEDGMIEGKSAVDMQVLGSRSVIGGD